MMEMKEQDMMNEEAIAKKEKGHSSRTRNKLIKLAIEACEPEDRFNTYKVCEKLAEIMVERYKESTLTYQSERMGLDTTKKMMKHINMYFYKM
ncbi:hypothetical protein [Inconstantimicrobium porci]|nr:hypothetical protein [Inconstantimicrobium porci]